MAQQQPDYVRLNPNMTVPTLVLADRILDQSRDIAEYALGVSAATLDGETKAWLDLHYGYPIEELTFGGLLARSPLARIMIPRQLEVRPSPPPRRVPPENPDLAKVYEARAAVFAGRVRAFDPAAVVRLSEKRRAEALGFMDRLEQTLHDGRAVLVPPAYGAADVVWTVFLARMEFVGMGAELQSGRRLHAIGGPCRRARALPRQTSGRNCMYSFRLIGGILGVG